MIPGVLRGVIASSWLRASDQLRSPNAVTTGQNIPEVHMVSLENWQTEGWIGHRTHSMVSQTAGLRSGMAAQMLSQMNSPLRMNAGILAIVRKVP